jgi:hypothetical protein
LEVDRCRHAFPDLRILSGIELSEGHWHPGPVAELLAAADLDRVVGSVHALPDLQSDPTGSAHVEVGTATHSANRSTSSWLTWLRSLQWPPATPHSRCSATSTTP